VLRLSVVIPVYNPGPAITGGIRSLLGQGLPPEALELIFVDDGSADGTAERLDQLAADRPEVTAVHIARSGAPGRPRNVGLDLARGNYVAFVDADDELFPGGLAELLRFAERHRSDIAAGLVTSAFRDRPQHLFEEQVRRCTLRTEPRLIEMTAAPGKVFRTAFVRSNQIRFPEGWRRGEDQLFTVQALARARVVSVLPIPVYQYRERQEGGHLTGVPLDVLDLARVPQIVEPIRDAIGPGPLLARLLSRFLRVEILRSLTLAMDGDLATGGQARRDESLFGAGRAAAAMLGREAERWLPPVQRRQAELLRNGNLEAFRALARAIRAVDARAELRRAAWLGGELVLDWQAGLSSGVDGRPIAGHRVAGQPTLVLPAPGGDPFAIPVGAAVGRARGRAMLREVATAREVADVEPVHLERPAGETWAWAVAGRSTLPLERAISAPSDSRWSLIAELSAFGLTRRTHLSLAPGGGETLLPPPLLVRRGGRAAAIVVRPTPDGSLELAVEAAATAIEPSRWTVRGVTSACADWLRTAGRASRRWAGRRRRAAVRAAGARMLGGPLAGVVERLAHRSRAKIGRRPPVEAERAGPADRGPGSDS
jgi:glycosyltransferase involved in cell wall biosynthesis